MSEKQQARAAAKRVVEGVQTTTMDKLTEKQFIAIQKTLKYLNTELERADLAIKTAMKLLQSPDNGIS